MHMSIWRERKMSKFIFATTTICFITVYPCLFVNYNSITRWMFRSDQYYKLNKDHDEDYLIKRTIFIWLISTVIPIFNLIFTFMVANHCHYHRRLDKTMSNLTDKEKEYLEIVIRKKW